MRLSGKFCCNAWPSKNKNLQPRWGETTSQRNRYQDQSFRSRQCVGYTLTGFLVSQSSQSKGSRRQGNTSACGPSALRTASSRSRSNGAVVMGCHGIVETICANGPTALDPDQYPKNRLIRLSIRPYFIFAIGRQRWPITATGLHLPLAAPVSSCLVYSHCIIE
jgi:hypothetical protein